MKNSKVQYNGTYCIAIVHRCGLPARWSCFDRLQLLLRRADISRVVEGRLNFARRLMDWVARFSTPFDQLPQNIDPGPTDKSYRVFSRAYDLIVRGDELGDAMASLIEILPSGGWGAAPDDAAISNARGLSEDGLADMQTALRSRLSAEQIRDTALCLLLDHSGSMRSTRALVIADFAEACADALSGIGVAVEVLGFTTRSWKGGNSRRDWERRGRPRYPGRLCDLLHIVHRDARSVQWSPHRFSVLRQAALYKENIDGEALQWASGRLLDLPQSAKVLIVVSDGAPVDDSTLSANWNAILFNHIIEVARAIEAAKQITLGGVGIEYDVARFYGRSTVAKPVDFIGQAVPAFIAELVQAAHGAK